MKKMDDEELQKWTEKNKLTNKETNDLISDDAKAYQFLFDVLDKEPLQGLAYDFSAKVSRKIQAETKRNSELRFYLFSIIAFIVVIAAIYGLQILIKPTSGNVYFTILFQYKWAFILCVFSFLTIQYLDQVLVKANIFKR
jgi:hypothetical protein